MIRKENIQDIYGLSSMQKSMLVHHALDASSSAYVEQFDFHIAGDVSPGRMEWALARLSDRYDILRTVFSYRKTDLPRQVVLKSWEPALTVCDFRENASPEEAVEAFKESDRERGFDLSQDVLLRGALLRTGERRWRFIFTFHHILMDGWSLGPLFQELFGLYEAAVRQDSYTPTREAYPYREYIRWLEGQSEEQALAYWEQALAGYEKPIAIPAFGGGGPYRHATHSFKLSKSLVERLNGLARSRQLTVNTLFQSAWGLLLQKYNYTRDAVFGSVVSGRPPQLPGVESMVGLFINTQPLRVRAEQGESFASLCANVQKASFASVPYEYCPLFDIQSRSRLKNKLLDHVVAFENYPLAERLRDLASQSGESLTFEDVQVFERTNYDFHVVVNPGETFAVHFSFNEAVYAKQTMEGLERSLTTLLEAACERPDASVDELSLCSREDRTVVVDSFNATRRPYPADSTVDGAFREVAARRGEETALLWRDTSYTYDRLNAWSDRLAAKLQAQGVRPGSVVGLMTTRCPEMVAGMLGILKAGSSYVPLDLLNSPERLAFMMEDAGIEVLYTRSDLAAKAPSGSNVLLLEESGHPGEAQPAASVHDARGTAYLMYTSGSTGRPKGCLVTHRNILRLVFGPDFIDFGPHQVILQTGSPAFDASTFEIWGALLHGGILALADEEHILDPGRLKALLERQSVSSMWLTAALFNKLCDQDPAMFRSLKNLIVGGDVLSVRHIRRAMEANPGLRIVNGYGPTENTTFSTTHVVTEADLESGRIPVGRPLANSTAYIVDHGLQPVPVGALGELCVGGDGIASGYHNRPELTEECFLDDPFVPGGRLYRTGDLARWLPDGTIDFVGRTDFQVKIRGYRVELGEIERTMSLLPGIKEVTVQVREIGEDKQLCAYFTSEEEPDQGAWKTVLSSKLPGYMVPAFFTRLDAMPLTVNGKVDRQALPAPAPIVSSAAPRHLSGVEKTIADIFSSVLGVEVVDTGDNFFEIGVNSLNLITINNRLKQAFDRDIPLTVLFEHTSIARLADYLKVREPLGTRGDEEQDRELASARSKLLKTGSLIRKLEDRA
ncbi:non-ribosomal peptide synthetase [Paenibacillus tyrfis]|uniref:non-ribosomal peptide synthetase n=1 Tax=Paenibacillus tyrfis TaxID=1501230 RepID=UPI0020A1E168|nr:amino acid adenylation domain-containing protein [Paenibacillus tyrfis]MCP1311721.1 amino acid adenylation domain-containing protein [Paenibacillus tyrfis]